MKSNLIRAIVFIGLGATLLIFSLLANGPSLEKWSSFALGASLPMFAGGLISAYKYFKELKQGV